MAHRKPNRKKRIISFKPGRYSTRSRVIRRQIYRKKEKKSENERRSRLYVIAGMALALAVIIISYHFLMAHQD